MRFDKEPLSAEEIQHREDIRSVYSKGYGPTELFHILYDAGCFRVISQDELDARNRAIIKAEELGLLDEYLIKYMLEYMITMHTSDLEKKNKESLEGGKGNADRIQFDI